MNLECKEMWQGRVDMARTRVETPCQFPAEREDQAEVIDNWLVSIDASESQRRRVLNCLADRHLRALPRCKSIFTSPEVFKARNWRILFYSNVAHILGWGKRRDFPDEILKVVREQLWPDEDELPNVSKGERTPCGADAVVVAVPKLQEKDSQAGGKGSALPEGPEGRGGAAPDIHVSPGHVPGSGNISQPQQPSLKSDAATKKLKEVAALPGPQLSRGADGRSPRESIGSSASTSRSHRGKRRRREMCRKRAEDRPSE